MIDYTAKILTQNGSASKVDAGLRAYMLSVYNYMAMALVVTGVSAFLTMNVDFLARIMFNFSEYGQVTGTTGFGMLIMLSPIAIAWYFFSGAARMDVERSKLILWVYAGLTGMSLSSLGFVYTGTSIARTFFITASVFGAMSLYGYTTKRDLTSMGSFLVMGLMGVLLASVVNMFMHSPAIYFVTSILGTLIFTGLIAWDAQKIKGMYFMAGGGEMGRRMAVVGAFSLYLDFINLFLFLIRFLGVKRSD